MCKRNSYCYHHPEPRIQDLQTAPMTKFQELRAGNPHVNRKQMTRQEEILWSKVMDFRKPRKLSLR